LKSCPIIEEPLAQTNLSVYKGSNYLNGLSFNELSTKNLTFTITTM